MNYLHLSFRFARQPRLAWVPLGIDGFRYADLNRAFAG